MIHNTLLIPRTPLANLPLKHAEIAWFPNVTPPTEAERSVTNEVSAQERHTT